jgi:hypothetical protein
MPDIGTVMTIIGAVAGAGSVSFGVIRWMMYMAKEAGAITSKLEHITSFCGEMKDHYTVQIDLNHEYGTRLTKVEGLTEHHGEELDRHRREIHELRHRKTHDA